MTVPSQTEIVADTLGNRISNISKALSVFVLAVAGTVVTVVATVPADTIPENVSSWINTGLLYAGAFSAWAVSNGPKIGTAIDTATGAATVFYKNVKATIAQ